MKIFISYSHKDAAAFDFLFAGMKPFIRSKQIQAWYDRYLIGGDVYNPIIKERMEESDVIIMLISFNFMNSDYILDKEIPIAVERFKKGARIIPIILENCPFDFLSETAYFGDYINVLPRTPDQNMFKPVDQWEKLAWTIIINQLHGIIKNADLNNAGPANSQPTTVAVPEENGKMPTNPGQSTDTNIQHPGHPIKNILSSAYTVADLLLGKNKAQETKPPVDSRKNDLSNIFDVILREEENTDELQGQITKIRLEDPDTAGIRKKCVVVGALTISLLKKYNRERVLMLMDFLEDKEPGLWERALVGLVLALSGRFEMLDLQIKRKLKALKNDLAVQETITNLFYILYFRNIKAEESLYINRDAFRKITFFQDQANWFLPFTKEDIPPDIQLKNEVFKYADSAILLKDDNVKYLTFSQYDVLSKEEQSEMEANLQKELDLKRSFFGEGMEEKNMISERTIQNYLAMLFSFLFINYRKEWPSYQVKDIWSDELKDLALNDVYRIKDKAIVSDSLNDKKVTSELYEEFITKAGSDAGALRYYGYYLIFLEDYLKALEKLLLAHSLEPLNVNLNSQIAYSYMSLSDYVKAIRYLEYAIILDPQNAWCLQNIGSCYQKISVPDNDKALEYYLKAFKFDPGDYRLLNKIGSTYQQIDAPDFEKSREFLEKGIAIYNQDPGGLSDLGYALQRVGNPDFKKALSCHLGAFALDDTNIWNIKNIGYCNMQLPVPDYKKALRYFKMALEDVPYDTWTLLKIALCYHLQSPPDYNKALEFYLRCYEIDKSTKDVKKNIGICYINKSQPDFQKAKEFLEQALSENPQDADILANLGYSWQLAAPPDYTKALDFHKKSYEIDKYFIWNIKNIGHCYINIPAPDYIEALNFLMLANEGAKNDDWTLKRIGYCYQCLEKPDFEKALDYHLQAYELNDSDIWNIQNVATCYSSLPTPDHQKALEYLLIAFDLDPNDTRTLTNIGLGYQDIDPPNWEEALKFHHKALEINPEDFWVLQNVGYCYESLPEPDHEKALEYYLKAESIKADDAINLGNIGICYRNMARYKEALQYFLRSDELNSNDKVILNELAFCYLDDDPPDYQNSYNYFDRAFKAGFKADGVFELNWGWVALLVNKLDEAEIHLKKGLELKPEESVAYLNLGHLEILRNNYDAGLNYYKIRLSKLNNKEEFIEVFKKDFVELEKLGYSREVFEKVSREVAE